MDNDNKKLKELENKIKALKKRKKKSIEWMLTKEEIKFLEELLGKENLVPIIYKIRTKKLEDLYNIKSSIVREVYYAHKAGKKSIRRPLKKSQMQELNEYEIKYDPIKFKIYLN